MDPYGERTRLTETTARLPENLATAVRSLAAGHLSEQLVARRDHCCNVATVRIERRNPARKVVKYGR